MENAESKSPTSKLPYEKPRLVPYGDLRTITRGGGGNMADGAAATRMCWIAEVLYGESDPRTELLRSWLINVCGESRAGKIAVALYRSTGRAVASMARRSVWLRRMLHVVFDEGVRRAQQHYMRAA